MKLHLARWVVSVSATMVLLALPAPAQAWNTETSVSGEAFGVFVNVAVAGGSVMVPKRPDVVLPPGGGMVEDEVLSVSFPGTIVSNTLRVITTGAIGPNSASAQSSATVEGLNIRDGLVTADLVVAMASSTSNGSTATSSADGSALIGLSVNGTAITEAPPPNTRIPILGVGEVILNEQIFDGDGVTTTALTVNMIHVVLSGAAGTGDIIVSSAHSDANFALVSPPPPSAATGFITSGGRLGTGRAIATFGFHAGPSLLGQLQYTDHAQGLNVHSTGITGYSSLGGTCVTASGIARVNNVDGYHFTVNQACDNGEPGVGRDVFEVTVEELSYSSRSLGTVLTGGNLQLH
jgi:hypothetical protein